MGVGRLGLGGGKSAANCQYALKTSVVINPDLIRKSGPRNSGSFVEGISSESWRFCALGCLTGIEGADLLLCILYISVVVDHENGMECSFLASESDILFTPTRPQFCGLFTERLVS